jgi:hypothetical protein
MSRDVDVWKVCNIDREVWRFGFGRRFGDEIMSIYWFYCLMEIDFR